MPNYQHLYRKYKRRYLELRTQMGGVPPLLPPGASVPPTERDCSCAAKIKATGPLAPVTCHCGKPAEHHYASCVYNHRCSQCIDLGPSSPRRAKRARRAPGPLLLPPGVSVSRPERDCSCAANIEMGGPLAPATCRCGTPAEHHYSSCRYNQRCTQCIDRGASTLVGGAPPLLPPGASVPRSKRDCSCAAKIEATGPLAPATCECGNPAEQHYATCRYNHRCAECIDRDLRSGQRSRSGPLGAIVDPSSGDDVPRRDDNDDWLERTRDPCRCGRDKSGRPVPLKSWHNCEERLDLWGSGAGGT
jgi:hypothetical protein